MSSHDTRLSEGGGGDSPTLAKAIRCDVLNMVHRARASHVASCFSIADVLAVLYGEVMRVRTGRADLGGARPFHT